MNKFRDYVIALIRTSIVPPIAGYILTRLPMFDNTTIEMGLVVILSGIWYSVFHGIEVIAQNPTVVKWAGIFLGFPRQPAYSVESAVVIEAEGEKKT